MRSPYVALVLAALLVLTASPGAGTAQSVALPATPYVRVLHVVPLEPTPIGTQITTDYLGRIVAMLDACARTSSGRAMPFAGRVRLVLRLSTLGAAIDLVDVEPGLSELGPRCLATAPPLPPLRTLPWLPPTAVFPDTGRIYVDAEIDARGFGRSGGSDGAGDRVELTVDTGSLIPDHYDGRLPLESLRDDLVLGLERYRADLGTCVANEARRRRVAPEAVELRLRVDGRGRMREVDTGGSGALEACVRSVLAERTLAPWRSRSDTQLRVTLRPRP